MLKAGAEHKLLVDFHGAGKPAGQERTYPNMIGSEGIHGMEFPPPYTPSATRRQPSRPPRIQPQM